jgi:tRNA modification GTPase
VPKARQAALSALRFPGSGEAIDKGLVLFCPGPKSFTGEDYAEFHVHGGRAVVAAMVKALSASGARPAEPGEFARRAFVNGKMDLAAAEGLADLIDAETEWQRRAALRQAEGALGAKAAQWRAALIEASVLIEAEIDFPEEEDVACSPVRGKLGALLAPVLAELRSELEGARSGERLREGAAVVIAGPPNAGKSTLLNALARRDVAIVSPYAGTTRDLIEVHIDLGGCPVILIDTAGLRESADAVERAGILRARAKAEAADLVLWLSEAAGPVPPPVFDGRTVWPLFTKADLLGPKERKGLGEAFWISAATGENIPGLIERLGAFAQSALGSGHAGLIARERHRRAFEAAASALSRVLGDTGGPAELLAEDLRAAVFALERLTGAVDVEDILDGIFARFCIGK